MSPIFGIAFAVERAGITVDRASTLAVDGRPHRRDPRETKLLLIAALLDR
jgi:hypothetical protein